MSVFTETPNRESDVFIDDVRLQDLGVIVRLSSQEPAVPNIRNQSVVVPNRHGAFDYGGWLEPREFVLNCVLNRRANYAELKQAIRDLNALFIDEWGRPKTVRLVFGDDPSVHYNVRLTGGVQMERIAKHGIFSLYLTAYDPFAYAPSDCYDPDFVPSYDTSVEYDSGVKYANQTSTPFVNIRQYAGIFNYSHYATPFSFVIEGYVKNPKITNLTSGKSAQLNITVEADERLYFDSKLMTTWKVKAAEDKYFWLTPYQIMKHEAEWAKINKYNDMSGDFLELVSGKNSILFEGENPNAYVNFSWEHRFL